MTTRINLPTGHNHAVAAYPRTIREAFGLDAESAVSCRVYRASFVKRAVLWCLRLGWVALPIVLAVSVLTGCDDLGTYAASQADLADAIAMAAKEAGR